MLFQLSILLRNLTGGVYFFTISLKLSLSYDIFYVACFGFSPKFNRGNPSLSLELCLLRYDRYIQLP